MAFMVISWVPACAGTNGPLSALARRYFRIALAAARTALMMF
jgi:hypothetical protein